MPGDDQADPRQCAGIAFAAPRTATGRTRTVNLRFTKPPEHPKTLQNGARTCVNLADGADRAAILAEIDNLADGLDRLRRAVGVGANERATG